VTGPTLRTMDIRVLSTDYNSIVGSIPHPMTASTTWQWQGVGTAVLIAPLVGSVVSRLMECRDFGIPVTFKAPGYPRWTGKVVDARAEKSRDSPGRITATLVDERKRLDKILAAPTPGAAWSAQTTEYDTRTGPLSTVLRAFMTANFARINALAAPVPDLPYVVTQNPVSDTSPTVTIKARNQTLADLFQPFLKAYGYDVTVTLWLPGDPQPNVATPLTTPRLVFDVVKGRDRQYVNFTETVGSIENWTVVARHPDSGAIAVGGSGEGPARVFQYVTAGDGRLTTLGPFNYAEDFLDATDADTSALRIDRANEKFVESSGKSSVSITLDDRRPWIAGPTQDYWTGDIVRATFNNVEQSDAITRMTLTSNENGFSISPQFGDSRETETPDIQTARKVQELVRQIAALKAGR
jgi:hypothetical protein